MSKTFGAGKRAVFLAIALMMASTLPALSQEGGPPQPGSPPPIKKKHHSGLGAAIGAGVLGGVVGGALLGSQNQNQGYGAPPPPPPDYPPPGAYQPPPPRYGYDQDAEDVECHLVRKPVYDEDGEIVDYKTRRVCH